MIRAGVGQSSNPSTERAAEQAALEAMAQAGISQADAVVVFFTAEHAPHSQSLLSTLTRVTRSDRIVGSSGAGILTGAGEIEGRHGLAVLVFASDQMCGISLSYFSRCASTTKKSGAESRRWSVRIRAPC